MARRCDEPQTRAQLRAALGVLTVVREPPAPLAAPGQPATAAGDPSEGSEVLLAVWDDGSVLALHGHVDLGTGLATALAQIVAEELDVEPGDVRVALGHTALVPNQGATIASASIQDHAAPLRCAAAQARAWLQQHASRAGRNQTLDALLAGRHVALTLATDVAVKDPAQYRIVGTPVARTDLPGKVAGTLTFVHDQRVAGMLHGRVVRPPYAGVDAGDFVGNTLESVDETSIAHLPGIRAVVVIRDFVGIVAEREDVAQAAMHALKVTWKSWPGVPPLQDLARALRAQSATRRVLLERGDVEAANATAQAPMARDYVWPYQLHGSIGPSCAVAHWHGSGLTVWSGTQNPHQLRADLARLTDLPEPAVDVRRMEASGCYGRNAADDVTADAVLLSRAVGAAVRVQLTREQEHLWEPKGAAQLMQVRGSLSQDGRAWAYDFETSYPSNGAPTLALLLTRTIEPVAAVYEMGDRTAVPPYAYPNLRVVANDMAPILRASWLRGVSALPNAFAHESFVDELATAARADPVEFRLRHLEDARAADLVRATADKAGWIAHTEPRGQAADGERLKGQGFAYARYVHSQFPGTGAAWAAWVADVEVDRRTGDVHVARVVVGHDCGLEVNPAGVRHQIHGNVLQATSRALKEAVALDPLTHLPVSREWGTYPILNFREVPVIEVVTMSRPGEPALGVGESSSVPGTAAIANAIFDATGVRLREPPFTPERVLAALARLPDAVPLAAPDLEVPRRAQPAATVARPPRAPRRPLVRWAAWTAALLGLGAAALGWRAPIPASSAARSPVYNAQTIERGRILAAAGNCIVCHTAPGGIAWAGGRAIETPFGVVYSSNLTPDAGTGIGDWSFSAFQRAMREGVSRDGHLLYPAFPYPSFTRMTDDDLTAVYAYLMSQAAVARTVPQTTLAFPLRLRALMGLWNAAFLTPGPAAATRGDEAWSRGAYLVDGIGHCGACHTGRNWLGAQRAGAAYLGGAVVGGWEAPALTALSRAPLAWSEADFFDYLRHGHSHRHGSASGPMAAVVRQLTQLPDSDVRAVAHYLASFGPPPDATPPQRAVDAVVARGAQHARASTGPAERLFTTACGACHHDGDGPRLLGQNIPLALSSGLSSERPDNLLRIILDGVREPASVEIGFMPGFRQHLDDRQIAELVAYLRARYAPDLAPWTSLVQRVARARERDD
jgi:nicotinate dehydrogenase subunit B